MARNCARREQRDGHRRRLCSGQTWLGRELARIYRFNFSALFALVFRIGERMIPFDE